MAVRAPAPFKCRQTQKARKHAESASGRLISRRQRGKAPAVFEAHAAEGLRVLGLAAVLPQQLNSVVAFCADPAQLHRIMHIGLSMQFIQVLGQFPVGSGQLRSGKRGIAGVSTRATGSASVSETCIRLATSQTATLIFMKPSALQCDLGTAAKIPCWYVAEVGVTWCCWR